MRLTLEELLSELKAREESIQDIQFDYEQTIIVSSADKQEKSSGRVVFKAPDRFKIDREGPHPQTFVCNGKKLWIYSPRFKQVVVEAWKGWSRSKVPPGLINVGKYVDFLKENFTLTGDGASDPSSYIVTAAPKDAREPPTTLKLWIHRLDYLPLQMEWRSESVLIKTKITRFNLNPGSDDRVFEFKTTPDMDIVHL